MASTSKRLSRKELRQPDWFQTVTESAFESYERHRIAVYAGIAVLVLLILGIWFYQNKKAVLLWNAPHLSIQKLC